MKKNTFLTVLLLGFIIQNGSAQSSTDFNVYNNSYYLGYDAANPGPLNFGTTGPPYQMTLLQNGNLDIFASTTVGYQINANTILWNGGSMNNIYVGSGAGTTSGVENTATGNGALHNNSGNYNTAIGYYALYTNTTGGYNTATGWGALVANTTGNGNTASGQQALYSNDSGSFNTAAGYEALNNNQSGSNNVATGFQTLLHNTANNNTAYGTQAMLKNTTGTLNTAVGLNAMYFNVTGTLNTAIGVQALYFNSGANGNTAVGDSALYSQSGNFPFYNSGNVAVGNSALYANDIQPPTAGGSYNTGIGEWAMRHNYSGAFNTASGYGALFSNVSGYANTADGYEALYSGGAGYYNTATGYEAGYGNNGSENTFLGYNAGYGCVTASTSNDVFIGYNAGPSVPGSNTIYLGNTSTGSIETYASMTLTSWSDRRVKDNIKANVPGLAFIDKLQPVTFNYNVSKENKLLGIQDTSNWPGKFDVEKITQSGFIAQQVDSAAQACGYSFSGVTRPKDSKQAYTLGYTTFVVPLVKAVQELSAKNDSLYSTVDSLRNVLQNIQNCLNQLCGSSGEDGAPAPHNNGTNGNSTDNPASNGVNIQNITLSTSTGAPLLYQNIPNPFSTGTKINYYLPQGTMGATIIFYDTYGNQIKTVALSQTGNGTLNITPDNLSNGIYSYSLIVGGSVIDTKKMMLQK